MNITERYKYQIGNHDNDLDFTTESEIDKLIIARNKSRMILEKRNFDDFTMATAKTITQEVEKQISKIFK